MKGYIPSLKVRTQGLYRTVMMRLWKRTLKKTMLRVFLHLTYCVWKDCQPKRETLVLLWWKRRGGKICFM